MDYLSQQDLEKSIKEICSQWWTSLTVEEVEIKENISRQNTMIDCDIVLTKDHEVVRHHIAETGKGVVDALYGAIVKKLSGKYSSLQDIKFKEFAVKANLNGKIPGSDAPAEAKLKVINSRYQQFEFISTSYSMNASAVDVVMKTIEFFINAHTAIGRTYRAVEDAKLRNRTDLIDRFSMQMSELVKVTCYADVISQIKGKVVE